MTKPEKTHRDLTEALAKIGWSIESSHNGLNHFLINHYGERTSFVLREDELEVRQDDLFGGKCTLGRGNCRLMLEDIYITVDKKNNPPEYVSINISEKCFIQLHNHDDKDPQL